jgi:uncharacterized protein (DUF58 family)
MSSVSANPTPTRSPREGWTYLDPVALMRIKSLELRARTVVEGFYSGIHRSPYHGFSVEFSEYRQYTPGDDLRYLDWRLFARSDRYYIKRFEDETNVLCYLLVDQSRSMGFGQGEISKWQYAQTMAATMAYFLNLQRDAVGLVTFDEQIVDYLPPRHRTGHLRHLLAALSREPAGTSTNLAAPLEQIAQTVRRRGLVVLVSDLLAPVDELGRQLGYLRSQGHDMLVLRVLDRAELEFTFDTSSLFYDMETGERLYIDPAAARRDYLERFAAHAKELEDTCRQWGVELVTCPTDRPLELSLFDLLKSRQLSGQRTVRRSSGQRGGR